MAGQSQENVCFLCGCTHNLSFPAVFFLLKFSSSKAYSASSRRGGEGGGSFPFIMDGHGSFNFKETEGEGDKAWSDCIRYISSPERKNIFFYIFPHFKRLAQILFLGYKSCFKNNLGMMAF